MLGLAWEAFPPVLMSACPPTRLGLAPKSLGRGTCSSGTSSPMTGFPKNTPPPALCCGLAGASTSPHPEPPLTGSEAGSRRRGFKSKLQYSFQNLPITVT